MEKVLEALAVAVAQGSAMAPWVVIGYFVSTIIDSLSVVATLCGIVWMVTRCVLRYQQAEYEHWKANPDARTNRSEGL